MYVRIDWVRRNTDRCCLLSVGMHIFNVGEFYNFPVVKSVL